ncbi:hypothetical protein IGI47_000773 [Enterococcus sp. AZ191]|uniref:hypothetical protein n=1 Tax=Enterococcus sp. AZ191 TaxID=2774639 RepID=UPI003F2896CE
MKNWLIRLLDKSVIKYPFFSRMYVHSELKANRTAFDKHRGEYDTTENLYKRFKNIRKLLVKNEFSSQNFKKICLAYYDKNFYLSDYYMYLINMNQQKLTLSQIPRDFKLCLETETLQLRKKLLFLVDYPHLNVRLNETFTEEMIGRATPSLVMPDVYIISLLKNRVEGARWYSSLKSRSENTYTLASIKKHTAAQKKSAIRRRSPITKSREFYLR